MSDTSMIPHENPSTNQNAMPQLQDLQNGFSSAFKLIDDVVLKNYITNLPNLSVVPLDDKDILNNLSNIRLFRITEMVYEKDESSTYKFASVFNTVAATNSSLITIIDSNGEKTDFYLGIRSLSVQNSTLTSYNTLVNSMKGQFPGFKSVDLEYDDIRSLLESFETGSLSSVSCVANNKNKDFVDNREYLQGLEKLALAMQGNRYTAVIIANPTSQDQLNIVRQGYESIYTQLSPYANTVVNYGASSTESNTTSNTDSENHTSTTGESHSTNRNTTTSKNTGEVQSISRQTAGSKVGSTIGATLSVAGAVVGSLIPIPGVGTAVGAAVGSAIGGCLGMAVSTATNKSVSTTSGGGSVSTSAGTTDTTNNSFTDGESHSYSVSQGLSIGQTNNLQLTIQNKPLLSMLNRIDKQLERLDEFESAGMWECAAYFLSSDTSVSKVAAATYKALMSGENSGLEVSAINTWNKPGEILHKSTSANEEISKYIRNFIHPVFNYNINGQSIPVTPTTLVSGNELAIHMGLPRHSVSGFPVIEHADFGKEIVRYDHDSDSDTVQLGKIFNMGRVIENSKVSLDVDSLAMHTLVVGATGSGKSNTIYNLVSRLTATRRDALSYMIIEPAKGEYKRVFGHKKDVSVFGTNPAFTQLLRINPFKFPTGIHVLEHIDRLIEIFNVCWPMYAAMPAILKDAVLSTYKACGWDLIQSKNIISEELYPTFQDLLDELIHVIANSGYSDEVKSNYVGSLTTRVRSLTNGLNGQIFTSNEIDNATLFDSNVIIDLSRVSSPETKALIMGILVMRLSEHRLNNSDGTNCKLRHITILEEAHNILGSRHQDANAEGANISEKSIEMLSNAIAEMRTYGEGFIIADQSPGAIDISAIRNTNTKIIMRLPEENDRWTSGKSAALKENQIDEIARLPQGVAVVYQNDWIEPVLCKIDKFDGTEQKFIAPVTADDRANSRTNAAILAKFILHNRLDNVDCLNIERVESAIKSYDCPIKAKASLYTLIREYRSRRWISIWDDAGFERQAKLVETVLGLQDVIDNVRLFSFDINAFCYHMNSAISQKINKPSDDLLLAISHCLVKANCDNSPESLEFYRKWVEQMTERRRFL